MTRERRRCHQQTFKCLLSAKIPFVVVNGSYEEKWAQDGDLGNALINERLVYSTYTEMIY